MMLLAVVVGVLAGVGTYLFEMLLHGIKMRTDHAGSRWTVRMSCS